MAIAVVAVLLTAGLALNQRIRGSVTDAIHQRSELVLSEMAVSGVHAAMVMLINDAKDNATDTIQEDWANPETVAETVNAMVPFDDGKLEVRIEDEKGKIQVNALVKFPEGQQFDASQRFLWERLLDHVFSLFELMPEEFGPIEIPDSDPNMIINSLKDWLDSGDDEAITGLSGAESDYYEGLDPPYACKNGPMDHLGELALVQGITPTLFSGAGGVAGLSSLITVHGVTKSGDEQFTYDGKINISTADVAVIAALLPSENADLAEPLAEYRIALADESFVNDITSTNWYKNVPGVGDVSIDENLISLSSDLFRIVSVATRGNLKATVSAVVRREKEEKTGRWVCKTLIWQAE